MTLLAPIAALLGFVVVVTAGVPIVSWVADARFARRAFRDTYDPAQRAVRDTPTSRFKPLDLGPDPLVWPSASGHGRPWRDDRLAWPSTRWADDPFFGRRAAGAREAAKARVAAPSRSDEGGDDGDGPIDAAYVQALVEQHGPSEAARLLATRMGLPLTEVLARLRRRR